MMQRKPGFPVAGCSIKIPDGMPTPDSMTFEDEGDQIQRRQQLINFGHIQWGFNNWSWSVTKQDLDFVDFSNGKYCVGVVAFVSVTVKSLDIHRENIGYATSLALNKGAAIYKSRKCAVTNALRETLLSFGGSMATELMDLLDVRKADINPAPTHVAPSTPPGPSPTPTAAPEPQAENNQNITNKQEPKNSSLNKNIRKDSSDSGGGGGGGGPTMRSAHPHPVIKNAVVPNLGNPLPVAKAHPMPVTLPPSARPPAPLPAAPRPPPPPPHAAPPPHAPHLRPNSNEGRPLESMTEEEARAERKRRQQRAQEEFRRKHNHDEPGAPRASTSSSASFDRRLMDIPLSQDIEIEQMGEDTAKRKSPVQEGNAKKRAVISSLDIVTD